MEIDSDVNIALAQTCLNFCDRGGETIEGTKAIANALVAIAKELQAMRILMESCMIECPPDLMNMVNG